MNPCPDQSLGGSSCHDRFGPTFIHPNWASTGRKWIGLGKSSGWAAKAILPQRGNNTGAEGSKAWKQRAGEQHMQRCQDEQGSLVANCCRNTVWVGKVAGLNMVFSAWRWASLGPRGAAERSWAREWGQKQTEIAVHKAPCAEELSITVLWWSEMSLIDSRELCSSRWL